MKLSFILMTLSSLSGCAFATSTATGTSAATGTIYGSTGTASMMTTVSSSVSYLSSSTSSTSAPGAGATGTASISPTGTITVPQQTSTIATSSTIFSTSNSIAPAPVGNSTFSGSTITSVGAATTTSDSSATPTSTAAAPGALASLASTGPPEAASVPQVTDTNTQKQAAAAANQVLSTILSGASLSAGFTDTLVSGAVTLTGTSSKFNPGTTIESPPTGYAANMVVIMLSATGITFSGTTAVATYADLTGQSIPSKFVNKAATFSFVVSPGDGSIWYAFDTSKTGNLVVDIFSDTTALGSISFSYTSTGNGLRRRSGLPLKFTQGYVPVTQLQINRNVATHGDAPGKHYTTHTTTTMMAGWVNCQAVARDREFAHGKFASLWQVYNSPHPMAAFHQLAEESDNPVVAEYEYALFKHFAAKLQWCVAHKPQYEYTCLAAWANPYGKRSIR
ncbi:hypothetical protein BC830DRAFT_1175096 [Chytriomyces sp. MP71]|nr:hypothetical protein BC830DRAFT_1175096 [Chytriomyces sp. MP71]